MTLSWKPPSGATETPALCAVQPFVYALPSQPHTVGVPVVHIRLMPRAVHTPVPPQLLAASVSQNSSAPHCAFEWHRRALLERSCEALDAAGSPPVSWGALLQPRPPAAAARRKERGLRRMKRFISKTS